MEESDHLDRQRAIRGIGGGDLQAQIYPGTKHDHDHDTFFQFDDEEHLRNPNQNEKRRNGFTHHPREFPLPREPSRKHIIIPDDDDDDEEENTSAGSSEEDDNRMQVIANSKLMALLSSLEDDPNDDGQPKRKTKQNKDACNPEQLAPPPLLSCSVPSTLCCTAHLDSLEKMETHRANFKFLKGSPDNNSVDIVMDRGNAGKEPRSPQTGKLRRSVSAPSLGDEKGYDVRLLEDFEIKLQQALKRVEKDQAADESDGCEIRKGSESTCKGGEPSSETTPAAATQPGPEAAAVNPATNESSDEVFKEQPSPANDEEETGKSKYKRGSSLKSGKTPPSSPGVKKIVRFADLWGQELTSIRTFSSKEKPKIPRAAYDDLDVSLSDIDFDDSDGGTASGAASSVSKAGKSRQEVDKRMEDRLQPLFLQPSSSPRMFNNLRDRKVSLETAYVCHKTNVINGVVRVANIAFGKIITVRYTTNEWASYRDVNATHLSSTNDGFTDRFSFVIDAKEVMGRVGARLQFCVRYRCLTQEYWDNNSDANYVFQYFEGYKKSSSISIPNGGRNTGDSSSGAAANGNGADSWNRGGGVANHSTFSHMSHSPSTSDDPWSHLH